MASKFEKLKPTAVSFTREAENALSAMLLSKAEVLHFIKSGSSFPVVYDDASFETIVFELNHADRGILLRGRVSGAGYKIYHVGWSESREEMAYFRMVAEDHAMSTAFLPLQRRISNCEALTVEAWIQVKLWLKHRLSLERLRRLIDASTEQPIITMEGVEPGYSPRLVLQTRAVSGRSLRVVMGADGPCPSALITAFQMYNQ
ncbi:MAG: hypothetical protein KF799_03060 [Bdellovibrionales bacterium]|nr:hypothetical protein [Bdellovibrionales bacterium]